MLLSSRPHWRLTKSGRLVLFHEQLGGLCRFPDNVGDADAPVGTAGDDDAIGQRCVDGSDALFMADIVLRAPGWPAVNTMEEGSGLNAEEPAQFGLHGVEQLIVIEQHRLRAARAAIENAKQRPSIRSAAIEL